jgi:RNA polymerase sigma-54 factor
MKQSLQLRLGQHLTMTPQLQQAIRLLQLSTLELQTEVQQVLESNPLLEMTEEGESDTDTGGAVDYGSDDAAPERLNGEEDTAVATSLSGEISVGGGEDEMAAGVMPGDIPAELPVDTSWEDVYDSGGLGATGAEADNRLFEIQDSPAESLRDHLTWQMDLAPFTDTDRAIASSIIDSIDDDGYLTTPLEEIQQGMDADKDVELDEVEAVLHRIQNFDPPGVAARDLRECLMIQLQQLPADVPMLAEAKRLVDEHLPLLANREYTQLTRRLKLDELALQAVIDLIQTLNPRPGNSIASSQAEYVIPDVIVRKHNGAWRVELNEEAVPRLRINKQYASLIRRADSSSDNTYLKGQLQEARWFLKSLQSRHETLLKVASCIVERQRGFLEHGEEAMKALVLHDVAEVVGMHESTISRVTTKKYMWTPRGIFELKYFFSSHVSTAAGGECSSTAIRALIKKLVAAENQRKPLSDSKIALILCEQGINVARRTVAKYREAMAIPPSNERKRLI